jgi:hypothetical protein
METKEKLYNNELGLTQKKKKTETIKRKLTKSKR